MQRLAVSTLLHRSREGNLPERVAKEKDGLGVQGEPGLGKRIMEVEALSKMNTYMDAACRCSHTERISLDPYNIHTSTVHALTVYASTIYASTIHASTNDN